MMIEAMAYNFLPAQRDQVYLMPPSLDEWLPGAHLAHFLLDVVGQLDLSGFYEHYRSDGLGHPAYEPSVMVSVLRFRVLRGRVPMKVGARHAGLESPSGSPASDFIEPGADPPSVSGVVTGTSLHNLYSGLNPT
jgi:hypothetical protein